jgi:hypothetical protein
VRISPGLLRAYLAAMTRLPGYRGLDLAGRAAPDLPAKSAD